MGLMKTLSQSSKELKDILDRLTALESGKTFVTKPMFDFLNERLEDVEANMFLSNHPVGSIYMSVNNTNPSTLFGGIWIDWGTGRVPICVDTSDSDFNSVEKTGGKKAHVLTQSELPASLSLKTNDIGFQLYGEGTNQGEEVGTAFGSNTTLNLANAGGGQAHNNLPPYITCYMWKRVS